MAENLADVAIIGGSIAGLIAGNETAKRGIDTTILEEHREIGVPEKCDGLVSMRGMNELGLLPPMSVVQNSFAKAVFFSPSMKEVAIDAKKQNVVVLDRSRFDKYLAEIAAKAGADLQLGKRVGGYVEKDDSVSVKLDSGAMSSKILLDCSGYESYIKSGGAVLQGGQYLVYGSWFDKSTVEVYLDPVSAPAFFKWVIPISNDVAKIGVAGEGINTFSVLDEFAKSKKATAIRKSAAPVICAGTIANFVQGRVAKAGDAAGQAKPTTGGGIYTGGCGGLFAGRSAAHAIESSDVTKLEGYERSWRSKFDREFKLQLRARNMFKKLSVHQIDELIEMVGSSDIPRMISEEGDFDRHSVAIIKSFGLGNLMSTFGMVFMNEIKSFLS
ncbi:MAG: NAD(P)/FAD-dependent oxidoreductase [Nitrososphaerota archaeon]|nr:NAD(P)/FAD-dependent oxidoreductase [Nitrososphaerota archaeon]